MSFDDVVFFLRFGYLYDQAKTARIGELLSFRNGKLSSITEGHSHLAPSDQIAYVRHILSQSIRECLTFTRLPAVFLSGGIDSPLIAAAAQALAAEPLKAFTFSTQDARTDETDQAAVYAREIGLEHHIVSLDASRLPALIFELMPYCDEPPGDYSIIPTYLVCREAKKHADVILSGDGADELFWGYASRMSRVIRLAPLFRLPKWQRKLRWWLLRRPYEWNPRYFDTIGEWYRSAHEHNFEAHLKRIFPTLPALPEDFDLYDFDGSSQDETAYWTRWNEFSGHFQAGQTKVRMASNAAGIQVASPFLDETMIQFASGLDWRSCLDIEREVGKLPLRALLKEYVASPSAGKLGFGVPMGSWLRGPLRGLFEDYVLSRDALMGLEINREAMRADFEDHLSGRQDRAWGLWIFLSLAIWEDVRGGKSQND